MPPNQLSSTRSRKSTLSDSTAADVRVVGTVGIAGVVVVVVVAATATKVVKVEVAAIKPSQVSPTNLDPSAGEPDIQTSRLESGPDVITIIDTGNQLFSVQSRLPAHGRTSTPSDQIINEPGTSSAPQIRHFLMTLCILIIHICRKYIQFVKMMLTCRIPDHFRLSGVN